MTITSDAASVYRDYVTPDTPSSGPYRPPKADVRALFAAIDAATRSSVVTTVASGSSTDMGDDDLTQTLEINKPVGGAHAVTLPSPTAGRRLTVIDGKGDAGTNNITLNGTINGGTSTVIASNYGWVHLIGTGTKWLITG